MPIVGLGTDIVEIARIEKQLGKSSRLAERILRPVEFDVFKAHNFPAQYVAKRFAAKEAAVKALGTGIAYGVGFQDVEVISLPSGQPGLSFSGKFAEICESRQIKNSFISISDEQHYAVATVILESV